MVSSILPQGCASAFWSLGLGLDSSDQAGRGGPFPALPSRVSSTLAHSPLLGTASAAKCATSPLSAPPNPHTLWHSGTDLSTDVNRKQHTFHMQSRCSVTELWLPSPKSIHRVCPPATFLPSQQCFEVGYVPLLTLGAITPALNILGLLSHPFIPN